MACSSYTIAELEASVAFSATEETTITTRSIVDRGGRVAVLVKMYCHLDRTETVHQPNVENTTRYTILNSYIHIYI